MARGPGGDVEPFELARGLDRGTWTEAEWTERCRRYGLAEATLGGAAPAAPGAPDAPAAPAAAVADS
jgi:hypothetical protein